MSAALRPSRSTSAAASPWQRMQYTASRSASGQPPPPRPFKPALPEERISRHPPQPEEPKEAPKKSFLSRLWPFRTKPEQPAANNEPKDPARGVEAAQRVVREGVLDPRYKPMARRVTRLLCALPIAIYLSYELFRRRFLGVEQKQIPPVKGKETNEKAGDTVKHV